MTKHKGSCHCGAVTFTLEADIDTVITCNCSHCHRKGMMLTFAPKSQFELLSGEDNLTEYRFNKKQIEHLFCKTCGVQCFGFGKDEQGNDTVAVNVRTLEDVDTSTLQTQEFNGKDF